MPHSCSALTAVVVSAFALPLVAQDLSPVASFTNPAAVSPDSFGSDIALDGDRAAVSRVQQFSTGNPTGLGFVDLYERVAGTWNFETTLTVAEELPGDRFGEALASSGSTLVVGAPGRDDFGESSGAVYVFGENANVWSLQAKITAPDAQSWEQFGNAVAVSGNRIVIGTSYGLGGAYVYVRSGTSWSLEQQLVPVAGFDFAANFGSDVAIDGSMIAIGADGYDGVSYDSGAVYIFERDATAWSESVRIESSDLTVGTNFGRGVDLEDGRLLVGAITGRAYVFEELAPGSWSSERFLETCTNANDFGLGATVAWSGTRALVPSLDEGTVYVFESAHPDSLTWGRTASLSPSSTVDDFGFAVAADGDEIWVGAPGAASKTGEVSIFDAAPIDTWRNMCAGLAGTAGVPALNGAGELLSGSTTTIDVRDAAPSAIAGLVIGFTTVEAPFKGGTLIPSLDVLIGLATDAAGEISIVAPWPGGVPAGVDMWLQTWIVDATGPEGFSATNALQATTN